MLFISAYTNNMHDRRINSRIPYKVILSYKPLNEIELQVLSENFSYNRFRMVAHDKLVQGNKQVGSILRDSDVDKDKVLEGFNEQIKLLTDILFMHDGLSLPTEIVDVVINVGGMRFATHELLEIGQVIELQIYLESYIPRILIIGEVLRNEFSEELDQAFAVVTFSYIEPEDKAILQNFVEMHKNG